MGERAAVSTQHKSAKRRSGSGAVSRRYSPVAMEEDKDEEEDEEENEVAEQEDD